MPKEAPGSKPGTALSQRSNFSADGMQLVAAEYVLDFGHVIKGTQKVSVLCLAMTFMPKGRQGLTIPAALCEVVLLVFVQVRKFKAINTGSVGVSFVLDSKAMEKAGFFVSPDKVPVLAGAPTHAALELTITLQVSLCTLILPASSSPANVAACMVAVMLRYKNSVLIHPRQLVQLHQ